VYLLLWVLSAAAVGSLVSLRTLSVISTLVPAAAAFVLLSAYAGRPLHFLGLARPRAAQLLFTVVASLTLVVPAMSLQALVLVHFKVPKEIVELLSEMIKADSLPELAYVILTAAVAAAVCEEIVFRGILQRSLAGLLGGWPSVLVASFVFGLLHDPWRLPAAFCLGLFLGLVYWRTGSLLLAMVAHFTVNCVAVVGYYLVETGGDVWVPAWVNDERPAPLWLIVLSLTAFLGLMKALWKKEDTQSIPAEESHDL
jgi:membrane protease YdiL (CAAX protease family)